MFCLLGFALLRRQGIANAADSPCYGCLCFGRLVSGLIVVFSGRLVLWFVVSGISQWFESCSLCFVLFYNLFFSPSFRVLHRRFGWFLSFMCWGQLLVHSVVVSGWFCGLCSCRFTYLLSVVCLVLCCSVLRPVYPLFCVLL